MRQCCTFKSPGPPWYAAQCQLENGHKGNHKFGTRKQAEQRWQQANAETEREVAYNRGFADGREAEATASLSDKQSKGSQSWAASRDAVVTSFASAMEAFARACAVFFDNGGLR